MRRRKRGFTLIELLMVITILATLLLIVVVRVRNISVRARESAMRSNLVHMRQAVMRFQNDMGGLPTDLDQLVLTRKQALTQLPECDATGTAIDKRQYRGPYFIPDSLPLDPFIPDGEFGYDSMTGHVFSRSTRAALDGTLYASW